MLEIRNLCAEVEGKPILRGINLTIRDGEVHVLMGPNGSGKSTLCHVLVGNPKYAVTGGSATFNGKDLLALPPEHRSYEGLFMSFQTPTEIPGVSMTNFLRAAVNARRKYRDEEPLAASEFLQLLRDKRKLVGLDAHFMSRGVNEGFSGGERKRNEIFQMAVLAPTFSILDETDSGLDVDALRTVADGFNALRTPRTSAMVVTHYQRMLDYLKPDFVHVLMEGRIVRSGDASLGYAIEERGFDWIRDEAATAQPEPQP
ncbi:MAG: Fe-S cluster assembly ATPase SufC [Alloprevotella sp.]|nr:Fe-S cluster assembly ATPase SufC [Alloprevotella sp.]